MATFTTDMNLEKPSEGASNAGESINDNSDKLELRTLKVTLGETVAQYDYVYWDSTSGKYKKAQADTDTKKVAHGLALTAGILDDQIFICYMGRVDGGWSFSGNGPVYLDASTAGAVTQTPPAKKVLLGYPTSTTEMFVIPPIVQS